MDPLIGYVSLAVVLVLVSLLCYATVRYYADPLTMHPLATAVVVCSLFVGLFSVMLLPVDVFVLTFEAKHSFLVRDAYFVCFALLAVLAFVCIPFAYFFTEDFESGAEMDQQPCCTRTMSAAKYTSLLLVVILILFFIGLLIEPGTSVHMANKEEFTKWVGNLMDVSSGSAGERALLLSTAVLTAIGCVNVVLYSGYGLFALPFRILRSPRQAEQHQQLKADFDQLRIRERKKEIQNKYSRSNRLGTQDLRELANLNRQEKLLSRIRDTMESSSGSPCSAWLLQVLFPFRVALGLSFLAASVLVVVSAFLTSLDKALNSFCGMHCGFLIDRPHIFNPMDKMLVALSQYFPSDYIALSFFTLYMFVTSLYGIFRIGIRICGIEIFKIKRRATWPQALLLCALLLMVMILSLAVLVLTLAPQYATFGSQTIPSEAGAERVPCAVGSLSAVFRSSADQTTSEGDCAMSQLAMIMARISIGMPLFSLLVYACVWLFVLVAVITFFREYARKEPDATELEDPDDLELTGLLSRSSYA